MEQFENIIFEIISTGKENNRENSVISIISLGECEKKLRNLYNIGSDQELIIFNYQYLVEGLSAPIIEYEIYRKYDSDKEILNLDVCKGNAITILVPAYEFSKFHLCEENCQYLGYDFENKKDIYQCQVKTEMRLISEINTQTLIKMEKLNDFYNLISNEDNFNDTNNKENIIETIQNSLKNGIFNNFMQSALYSQPEGIIINSTNTYFQIIPADIQQYDDNDNETYEYNYLSRLNLSDCINILKDNYSIIDSLILFKMDHYLDGAKAPIVEYEIYQKNGSGPLNLEICKDVNVKLEIPVSLKEDDLLKYNLSSDYYTDICYSYKTEKGTDILLKDRQNECSDNNMFICDENCFFEEYDPNEEIALCSCQVKTNFSIVTNISSIDLNDTFNESSSTNVFKCTKTFFSKDGIKANIGSYLTMVIIVLNFGLFIYFKEYGRNMVNNEMNNILNKNQNDNNDASNSNSNPIKKRKKLKKDNFNSNIDINPPSTKGKSDSKLDFQNLEGVNSKDNNKFPSLNENKNKPQIDLNKYNDYELNNLNYNEAISNDSRTFFQYYCSLVKRKNLLLFAFITNNDYNPKIIKI